MRIVPDAVSRIVSITALGIVIGVTVSLAAIAFVETFAFLNDLLLISPRSRILADSEELLFIATVVVPAAGGLIVGCLHLLIAERSPQGPADVIQAVQAGHGLISSKSGGLSALTSVVSLGTGASVGQYGPLVHLGATLGSLYTRITGDIRARGKIGVGCGVAAAIATVFNAPIAGIVFAHEVILRHYSLRAFAPITVASTIGFVLANAVFQRKPLFAIEALHVAHVPEFFGFILLGILGALVAVVFMHAIRFSAQVASKLKVPTVFKPMLAGAMLGLAAIQIPDILGIGKETLRFAIINDAFTTGELALTLVAKILATALCIGFGFAGGVFSPALLVGILFGAFAGNVVGLAIGDYRSDIAIYAICGMVAVTSSVIGAPLTTILIVFELTRNYDLTTAAMVSVVFANVVGYRVFGRSLFDVQLRDRGFDLSMGREKLVLESRSIEGYLTQDFIAVPPETSLAEVKSRLVEAARTEAYVVDAHGTYLGSVMLVQLAMLETLEDLAASPGDPAIRHAARAAIVLTGRTSIWSAMEQMPSFVGESIPVVEDTERYRLLGVVFEATIIEAYLDTMQDMRHEEHAA
jgi:CIC family chloride channel protein